MYFRRNVQVHVSALDNGHLQVVHEIHVQYNLKMAIIKCRNM